MGGKLFKPSWWQRDLAYHLQQFLADYEAGLRPILLVQAPPQHGKSYSIVDFIAWFLGHNPRAGVFYTSFSDRLGQRANTQLQRMIDGPRYAGTFPDIALGKSAIDKNAKRTQSMLEIAGHHGFFRNTTVRGSITGEGLDLGVIDDPIKGREEASSQTIRDKTFEWLTDDFFTRLADHAAVLGIMTRWHIDDPFGRLIASDPRVKVLKYPAIATHDEEYRLEGEPLFPEHKSLEFLEAQRARMHSAHWEALYQQNPIVHGGQLFKTDWWQYWEIEPELEWRSIYADTASKTKTQNDWSVFQCWGRAKSGKAVLLDQIRGKWEAPELRVRARAFWQKHKNDTRKRMGPMRAFRVEDASSGTGLIQELRREGIPMVGVTRQKDKVERAFDVAPSVEAGTVLIPKEATWLSDWLAEVEAFPAGAHDDQVDPMMDAVGDILLSATTAPRIRGL